MLGRSNLLAIVGGGQAPKFPDRNGTVICKVVMTGIYCDLRIMHLSVMIWDDKKRKFVYEIGLPSRVVGVRMRTDR